MSYQGACDSVQLWFELGLRLGFSLWLSLVTNEIFLIICKSLIANISEIRHHICTNGRLVEQLLDSRCARVEDQILRRSFKRFHVNNVNISVVSVTFAISLANLHDRHNCEALWSTIRSNVTSKDPVMSWKNFVEHA